MSSLAILGGTFDPPHFGHLHLAECARHQLNTDRVIFMPAGDPYFKADRHVSAAGHRLEMVRLATRDHVAFEVDDREMQRGGPTYTVDTLRAIHAEGPRQITLILGLDALVDLPRWHESEAIPSLASIAVALKGESPSRVADLADAAGLPSIPPIIEMPDYPISSTLIRQRVAAGFPVRYLLPHAVETYVLRNGLYATPETPLADLHPLP